MHETNDLAPFSRSRTECALLGPWFEPCGLCAQQHHAMDQTRHLAFYVVSYIDIPRQWAVPVLMLPPLRGCLVSAVNQRPTVNEGGWAHKARQGSHQWKIQNNGSATLEIVFLWEYFPWEYCSFSFELGDKPSSPVHRDGKGRDAQR